MLGHVHRLLRRWQILALDTVDPDRLQSLSTKRLVRQFHRVTRRVPAYAAILAERGIRPGEIRSAEDLVAHAPILDKEQLFGRFPLQQLCVDANLDPLASVLTSSGHGSRFAFGLANAEQLRAGTRAIELGLELAFQTDQRRTLLINALPMGVRFSCSTVTVAETSVREDMVAALIREIAPHYEQTILVLDPLFCKRLIDYSREIGLDWSALKVHLILGEETFGEHFRHYVAARLGQDPVGWSRGFVGSSMGIGELGLNLFFETRETVRLRQFAHARPEAVREAIGPWPGQTPPLLFVYDPRRIFVEIQEPDVHGFGELIVSTLDPSLILPLLRYRTGDRAKRLNREEVTAALKAHDRMGLNLPRLPMIAMAGRDKDRLADGRRLLDFKDALYAEPNLADALTGAFRIEPEGTGYRIHLQLREGCTETDTSTLSGRLAARLPRPRGAAVDNIQIWRYRDFPFGMGLDYERKFSYTTQNRPQGS